MIREMIAMLPNSYPMFYDMTYRETGNVNTADQKIVFEVNDLLLCFAIFLRIYLFARTLLSASAYTDPRAQRVCTIYGSDADYGFALKSLMQGSSWKVLSISMGFSLFILAYTLKLFEQVIDPDFDLFVGMWNVLITMTTVGYGDFFPKTHCGRVIGIITAFWGTLYVSLFVVSTTNILTFDPSENKAFLLL